MASAAGVGGGPNNGGGGNAGGQQQQQHPPPPEDSIEFLQREIEHLKRRITEERQKLCDKPIIQVDLILDKTDFFWLNEDGRIHHSSRFFVRIFRCITRFTFCLKLDMLAVN